jgi:hypothetical protein
MNREQTLADPQVEIRSGENPPDSAPPPEDILAEALRLTLGDRQTHYGPPHEDFARTAGMWTSLFSDLLKPGSEFKPSHIAQAMILLKMSRQVHHPTRDNWTDVAGYARCGHLCDLADPDDL